MAKRKLEKEDIDNLLGEISKLKSCLKLIYKKEILMYGYDIRTVAHSINIAKQLTAHIIKDGING